MTDKSVQETASVAIDASTLRALSPDTIAHLKKEFGATFELRASKEGLASLLDNINKGAVGPAGKVGADLGALAAYDRGFDRTSPGYDKYYDRDRNVLANDLVSNPAETLTPGALDLTKVANLTKPIR